jgi:hypothetical protein
MKHLLPRMSLLLAALFAFAPLPAAGQDQAAAPSLFEFLRRHARSGEARLLIETDLQQLIKNKMTLEYQKARLAIHLPGSEPLELDLRLRARGNSRLRICYYPSVKLKFKKSDLAAAGFNKDFNEIKIVCQCRDGNTPEQYVAKEYLAYQLAETALPHHFHSAYLPLAWIDAGGKKTREYNMRVILLEDRAEMAQRLGAQLFEHEKVSSASLDREYFMRVAMFQYMIGNTDWSVANRHNLEFVKVPDINKLIPVPYDFDYSGLVNTDYAVPHESMPIKSVEERLYRGPLSNQEQEIKQLIETFQALEKDLRQQCELAAAYLDKKQARDVMNYLDSFFKELRQPVVVARAVGPRR